MLFSFTFRLFTAIRQSVCLVFLLPFFSSSSSFAKFFTFTFRFACIFSCFLFPLSRRSFTMFLVFHHCYLLCLTMWITIYFQCFFCLGRFYSMLAFFYTHIFSMLYSFLLFGRLMTVNYPKKWQKYGYIRFYGLSVYIDHRPWDNTMSSIFHSFVFGHPYFSLRFPFPSVLFI